ncbi:AraC family transcriptional regulator [Rhodospirillaceae bacterium KN72]|uniref:AraC family transcriptional regulator n=1 Tax=Pacificispira spongiicola TaxID=2729598 RepID=A0A7Y0HGS9_9PROT|nr:helix-turn-helix transcriptional regulator [Pacificispira spongiicola]NMM45247.1 AraC family transcriptional regulator [Pacificispira spongiicola]
MPATLSRHVEMRAFDMRMGELVEPHYHDWGQFTYSAEGVMTVLTEDGRFTAPPAMAVWLPPGVVHHIRTIGPAKFRSLYVSSGNLDGMPDRTTVLSVDPLLRQLILAAADFPRDWDEDGPEGRLMSVLMDRIRVAPTAKLHLPLPADARLRGVTDALLADPSDRRTLDEFAKTTGAAARTLARLFVAETGMSFGEWRRQRVLLAALERLGDGMPVTSVALDLGYDSPSAFIAMFRRHFGETPTRYMQV